jgi:hypothetical protein
VGLTSSIGIGGLDFADELDVGAFALARLEGRLLATGRRISSLRLDNLRFAFSVPFFMATSSKR